MDEDKQNENTDQQPNTDAPQPQFTPDATGAPTDVLDKIGEPNTAAPVLVDPKTVTIDGYTFTFDADVIDDVEVIEMAGDIENGKVGKIVDFLNLILGANGYRDMKNYFVTRDGKMRFSKLSQIFSEIFNNFDPKE